MSPITIIFVALTVSMSFNVAAGASYFSKAELHHNCLKVVPTSALTTEWGLKLFAGARFYIPFGSATAIQHISELLSGAKANGPEERKTCTNVRIKGFKLEMEGQGDHFMVQDCAVIKKGANDCKINPNSENPKAQEQGDGIFTIVWTDNDSSMAIVRCTFDGLYNDWYVFSTEPSLNETIKATVLDSMNKLGFSDTINDTISPSYDGCTLFDPEEEE
ncbi:hypothetical protein Ocin01_05450 [Orchesella cincta]|uniref:Apolipoprotein D n=1 Tax=Orchesella cincta TaxID=48709 RepID=A0A1D2N8C4_ORCCI|nr:hypothetical protein Ocin01_05450 [Orchesella cincta]